MPKTLRRPGFGKKSLRNAFWPPGHFQSAAAHFQRKKDEDVSKMEFRTDHGPSNRDRRRRFRWELAASSPNI